MSSCNVVGKISHIVLRCIRNFCKPCEQQKNSTIPGTQCLISPLRVLHARLAVRRALAVDPFAPLSVPCSAYRFIVVSPAMTLDPLAAQFQGSP